MRPRLRSYGETSTRTLSPGSTRMRNRRILPARCASSSWSFSSFTRNSRFGRASVTSPSISSFYSTAIGISFSVARASRRRTGGSTHSRAGFLRCGGPAGELGVLVQAIERRRLELPHALGREPYRRPDRAERPLAVSVEPVPQPHHVAIAALQAVERALDRAAALGGQRDVDRLCVIGAREHVREPSGAIADRSVERRDRRVGPAY